MSGLGGPGSAIAVDGHTFTTPSAMPTATRPVSACASITLTRTWNGPSSTITKVNMAFYVGI